MSFIREKNTPVMEQYLNLKAQYKVHLLFYRLGDFYELFFDDAIKAAKLLNIVITKRGNSDGQEIPMCGVPAHSSESYLHKLIDLGFKVAICDQLETADEAKKRGYKSIVKRDVVRFVTPARRNLELFSTQFGEKKGSLISVIDHTVTASGGRLLKQMLASPLTCSKAINLRLSTAQFFVNNHEPRRKIREILSNIPDIERSLSRLILGRGSPKDMNLLKVGLGKTLELSEFLCKIESGENGSLPQQYVIQVADTGIQMQIPASRAGMTVKSDESELSTIHKSLGNHKDLFVLLNRAILDNNLSSLKEGGFINPIYNSELSELSYILNNSNKQSLANSMRYTTNELKELENKILTARDATIGLEVKIFSELCSEVAKESEKIALAANALAKLD
ncbi:unnamed protein product [Parnassius apollo]|uniref:(apollo) hypothetical protein n=1 Tax=Parnassius apollo TaxID=110799 RepID=A0A8S3Y773_PARAO|nr:unnamed protein product [Parnassius apollo]